MQALSGAVFHHLLHAQEYIQNPEVKEKLKKHNRSPLKIKLRLFIRWQNLYFCKQCERKSHLLLWWSSKSLQAVVVVIHLKKSLRGCWAVSYEMTVRESACHHRSSTFPTHYSELCQMSSWLLRRFPSPRYVISQRLPPLPRHFRQAATVSKGCLPTVNESYQVEYQLAVRSVAALNESWQTLFIQGSSHGSISFSEKCKSVVIRQGYVRQHGGGAVITTQLESSIVTTKLTLQWMSRNENA